VDGGERNKRESSPQSSNVSVTARPREGVTATAQGHPRAIFRRAIERRNLLFAETTLRELGRPTLGELLELTILIAEKDPRRHSRVSARWLLRYLEVHDRATNDDATRAAACLVALPGSRQEEAASALRGPADSATGRRHGRGVA
jgi:hypothetical protein